MRTQGRINLQQGRLILPQGIAVLDRGIVVLEQGRFNLERGRLDVERGILDLPRGILDLTVPSSILAGGDRVPALQKPFRLRPETSPGTEAFVRRSHQQSGAAIQEECGVRRSGGFGVPGAEPPAPRFYGKHVVSLDLVLVYTRARTGFAVVLMVVVRYRCTLVAVSPAWIAGPIAGSRVLRAGSVIVVINLAH
jgi:hypothetical protein